MSQRSLYQINSNRKLQSSKNLDEIFINTLSNNKNDKILQGSITSTHMKDHLNRLNVLQKNVLNYILLIRNQLSTFQDRNQLNDVSVNKNTMQQKMKQNDFQQQILKTGKFEKNYKKTINKSQSKLIKSKQIITLIETSKSLNQSCQKMFTTLIYIQSNEKDQNQKEMLYQYELIIIKGYCYILVLNLSFISTLHLPQILSNSQLQVLLQKLFKILSLQKSNPQKSVHLFKLCLKQLFNLQTLSQFIQYNLNTNQQYKYDENTQIQFLFQIGLIKLSEAFGYFMLQTLQHQQALAIKVIYQQGKQSIQRCRSLLIRKSVNKSEIYDSNIQSENNIQKNSLIFNRIQEIQQFFCWLEQNWIKKIIDIIKSNNKLRPQLTQMPIMYVSNYHFFVIMYKFRQYEKSFVKFSDSIVPDKVINKQKFIQQYKIVQIRQKLQKQVLIIKKGFINNKSNSQNNQMQKQFIGVYQALIQKFNLFLKTKDISTESIQNLIENQSFKFLIEKLNKKYHSKKQNSNIFDPIISQNSQQISENKEKATKSQIQHQFKSNIVSKNAYITPKKQEKVQNKVQKRQQSKQKSQIQVIIDKNILTICRIGQYLTKFNYNNDSSSTKYLKLSSSNDRLLWGQSKQQVNQGNSSQIKMNKVVGLVYGNVTKKIIYHTDKSKGVFPLLLKIGPLIFIVILISMIFISGYLDYLIISKRHRKGKLTSIEVKFYGKNVFQNLNFCILPNKILKKSQNFIWAEIMQGQQQILAKNLTQFKRSDIFFFWVSYIFCSNFVRMYTRGSLINIIIQKYNLYA